VHLLEPALDERVEERGLWEEGALIDAAQAGDPDAFADLFRRHRSRVFYIARHFYAPGSDRDDLIQEATIGFYKAIRDYNRERGTFSWFVEMCVRRQVITFIKMSTRQKHAALNSAKSLDEPLFLDSEETLAARLANPRNAILIENTDNVEFLETLWLRCTELERGVLSMYTKGFSFEDMAKEIGVHYKSIDNAVWRVKVKAKRLLVERPTALS